MEGSANGSGGFWLALVALVLVGLGVRLAIIASPLGDLDADEAVVGLMARHIAFLGDRPVFYYNQQYLGSLEAFSAAPLFWLFNSSTTLLKLVPTFYSLGFLVAMALVARRLFGNGPALVTAAYLALPPIMWAVWSTKARGGYAEFVFLGALLLLVTLWLAERRRPLWGSFVWGLVAGLGLWTHLLAAVYVLPCVMYLGARRRLHWNHAELPALLLGGLLGALPMIAHNLLNGFPTIVALLQPPDLPYDPPAQLFRFFRVGIPVLAGLGQPTTSAALFDRDWLLRPAGSAPIAGAFLALLALGLALHLPALARLAGRSSPFRRVPEASVGPSLLLLLAMVTPLVVALTRFGFFVSEPRYALALYSVVPLLAASLWRLPRFVRVVGVAAVLSLNVYSIAATDIRLWRPEEAIDNTAETRAELVRWLTERDRHQLYTDYWIAYPIMFETREQVLTYVVSGGFNRYLPHAVNVANTPDAAWVFMRGSEAEVMFGLRLALLGGEAVREDVSAYSVYTNVRPEHARRPTRLW